MVEDNHSAAALLVCSIILGEGCCMLTEHTAQPSV